MEALAAFVAVRTGAFAAGQESGLGCATTEAVIGAGLVTEADVGETDAAGWAVIIGTAEGVRWDGGERRTAL